MMKFFRKHNKKLLAVFMALLLVVWLGGSALTTLMAPKPGKHVIAHTRFGDIRRADQAAANFSTDLLSMLRIHWPTLGQDPRGWPAEPLSLLDWVLLTREANQMGLHPAGQELDAWLRNSGLSDSRIKQLAVARDVNPDQIRSAFADFAAILQLQAMVLGAAVPSEAEVRIAARNEYENVEIEAVALRALTFIDPDKTFSQEQIQEHFEQYRDSEAVLGTLTFGYYQKPRVKVQYIRIEPGTIEDNLRIGEAELERSAKDFWRENRNAPVFRRPLTTQPADDTTTQPADETTTQPADDTTTQPATQPASEYYETYTEARQAARDAVRADIATQRAENLASFLLNQQLAEPFFEARTGPDEYRIAPDAVRQEGYLAEVLSRVPADLSYPEAVHIETTDWFQITEARALPDIGTATVRLADNRPHGLESLAFTVQGLADIPTNDQGVDRELYLSLYQFCPRTLRKAGGNLYLFRIVGVEPAHSPESVDVVREQVIEDLRLQDAMQEARKALQALQASAEQSGDIATAWKQDEDLQAKVADSPREGYFGPIRFAHRQPRQFAFQPDRGVMFVPGLQVVSYDLVDACFALGNDPGPETRLAILEEPAYARAVLVRWIQTIPMTRDVYLARRDQLLTSLTRQRRARFAQSWITSELIQTRNAFEPFRGRQEDEEQSPEEPEETEQDGT